MMLSSILDMLYPFGNKKKTDPRLNAGCLCQTYFNSGSLDHLYTVKKMPLPYGAGVVSTCHVPGWPSFWQTHFSSPYREREREKSNTEKEERKQSIFSQLCETFQFRRHVKAKWLICVALEHSMAVSAQLLCMWVLRNDYRLSAKRYIIPTLKFV